MLCSASDDILLFPLVYLCKLLANYLTREIPSSSPPLNLTSKQLETIHSLDTIISFSLICLTFSPWPRLVCVKLTLWLLLSCINL